MQCTDKFPTAQEAATRAKPKYARCMMAAIKQEILKAIEDGMYQTPALVYELLHFTRYEQPFLSNAIFEEFSPLGYAVNVRYQGGGTCTNWKIVCIISWFPPKA